MKDEDSDEVESNAVDRILESVEVDAEQKLATRAALEEAIDTDFLAKNPDVLTPVRRRSKYPVGYLVLCLLLFGVAFFAHFQGAFLLSIHREYKSFTEIADFDSTSSTGGEFRDLSLEERLLVGDPTKSELENKKAFFDSRSDDPAAFLEYVHAYVNENDTLPSDYFETIERIDPLNAFFLYYAAAVIGDGSVERESTTDSRPPDRYQEGVKLRPLPREPNYLLKDKAKFEEALRIFNQADQLPEYRSYDSHFVLDRWNVFEDGSAVGRIKAIVILHSISYPCLSFIGLSDIIGYELQNLTEGQDIELFQQLRQKAINWVEKAAFEEKQSLILVLINRVIISRIFNELVWKGQKLGAPEAIHNQKIVESIQSYEDQVQVRWYRHNSSAFPLKHSSHLNFLTALASRPRLKQPPEITTAMLKPGRMWEYSLIAKIAFHVVAVLLFVASLGCLLLPRFVVGISSQKIGDFLYHSIKPVQWALLFLFGLGIPFLTFIILPFATSLGHLQYGSYITNYTIPTVYVISFGLAIVLSVIAVFHWCMAKKFRAFTHRPIFGKSSAWLIGLFAASVFGAVAAFVQQKGTLPAILIITALALLFINFFAYFLMSIIGKPITKAFAYCNFAVLARVLVLGAIICLPIALYFQKQESYWLAKDEILNIDESKEYYGNYEFRVAAQARKELLEVYGME